MKPLNTRVKTILKFTFIAITVITLVILSWAAYIAYRGDEAPDAGRDAFYARSTIIIPDNQNLAVALSGINAPVGTDMIKHGRFVIDAYENDLLSSAVKNKIFDSIGIKFTTKPEEFDCWLDDAVEKTAENCASKARISELMQENKLLIGRYKKLYQIDGWQGLTYSGGQTLLNVNKLLAADIKLNIDAENADLAYQKWKANYVFTKHVLNQENTMIDKAIFLVLEGFCLNSLEYLTIKSPETIAKNKNELLTLLKPIGIYSYNLRGMLKAEYHFHDDYIVKKFQAEPQIHINYIRNRIYRAHLNFLKETQQSPFKYESSLKTLQEKYHFPYYNNYLYIDYLNPLNSALGKLAIKSIFNGINLAASMHSKNALVKLLNLKIKIQQQNIADADIQAYLNSAGSEYFNPFTNKPMLWDAPKRMIICDRPNSDESPIKVKL